MVADVLFAGGSAFITGIILLVGFLIGMFILRLPVEFVVLLGIPFVYGLVIYYVPALGPIIAIVAGIIIGFMFLKVVRR
jgi:hypothetical protein